MCVCVSEREWVGGGCNCFMTDDKGSERSVHVVVLASLVFLAYHCLQWHATCAAICIILRIIEMPMMIMMMLSTMISTVLSPPLLKTELLCLLSLPFLLRQTQNPFFFVEKTHGPPSFENKSSHSIIDKQRE